MKKAVCAVILAGALFSSVNQKVEAGPMGNKGRWLVRSDGTSCCAYALFINKCYRVGTNDC